MAKSKVTEPEELEDDEELSDPSDEDIVEDELLDDVLDDDLEDVDDDIDDLDDEVVAAVDDDEADDDDADDEDDEDAEALDELEAEELEMLTEDEASETLIVDEAQQMRDIRRAELAMERDPGSERAKDEFQCQSCFLVKKRSQLVDKRRKYCRDCAA